MALTLQSKFVSTYDKLLAGQTPQDISQPRFTHSRLTSIPNTPPPATQAKYSPQSRKQFWADLFSVEVESSFLSDRLARLSKDACVVDLKDNLHAIFSVSISYLRAGDATSTSPQEDASLIDARRRNALKVLAILVPSLLMKNMVGWEIMEVFAGGVAKSDEVFTDFVSALVLTWEDSSAPDENRALAILIALKFLCGVDQHSPGAYFLRRDLYSSLHNVISSPETPQSFASDAVVLLSILANYHKRDAANLNPYLQHIMAEKDDGMLKNICRVAQAQCEIAIKAYQSVLDDAPPTFTSSISNMFSALRPDVSTLSTLPVLGGHEKSETTVTESFSLHPVKAAIFLLPLNELLRANQSFRLVFIRPIPRLTNSDPIWVRSSPPTSLFLPTILSLSSYILTHATASGSARAMSYARTTLRIFHTFIEDPIVAKTLCVEKGVVRLCRQRSPVLPLSKAERPFFAALLDCCVLWLRHNLHKTLQVGSYISCLHLVHRGIRFLHRERVRLEYHWDELWRSLLGLMEFIAKKMDALINVPRLAVLNQLLIRTLAYIMNADFLPSPGSVHQLVYQLTLSTSTISNQRSLLDSLSVQSPSTPVQSRGRIGELTRRTALCLASLDRITRYYSDKIAEEQTRSVSVVMKCISREIGKDGVVLGSAKDVEDVLYDDDGFDAIFNADEAAADAAFIRWACIDGLQ